MTFQSLERKTIRPGSLNSYSFYYSKRSLYAGKARPTKKRGHKGVLLALVVLVLLAIPLFNSATKPGVDSALSNSGSNSASIAGSTTSACAGNRLSKFIKVSISARHLWACQYRSAVFNTPVITGMTAYPDTMTPTGTYQVSDKQTKQVLSGTDSTGSWNDPVNYWMPFLDNQYGAYGFHDATWRPNNAFGNIDPNSNQASHGCVELPLSSAKWLYGWAQVGTTLSIFN